MLCKKGTTVGRVGCCVHVYKSVYMLSLCRFRVGIDRRDVRGVLSEMEGRSEGLGGRLVFNTQSTLSIQLCAKRGRER